MVKLLKYFFIRSNWVHLKTRINKLNKQKTHILGASHQSGELLYLAFMYFQCRKMCRIKYSEQLLSINVRPSDAFKKLKVEIFRNFEQNILLINNFFSRGGLPLKIQRINNQLYKFLVSNMMGLLFEGKGQYDIFCDHKSFSK